MSIRDINAYTKSIGHLLNSRRCKNNYWIVDGTAFKDRITITYLATDTSNTKDFHNLFEALTLDGKQPVNITCLGNKEQSLGTRGRSVEVKAIHKLEDTTDISSKLATHMDQDLMANQTAIQQHLARCLVDIVAAKPMISTTPTTPTTTIESPFANLKVTGEKIRDKKTPQALPSRKGRMSSSHVVEDPYVTIARLEGIIEQLRLEQGKIIEQQRLEIAQLREEIKKLKANSK
jgi:hypothetical protein